jgi:site-specific DNA-methyltransferase (adenine-specific)/site-specific DNA-methyltransferase (cytosine-N4-specific)
VEDEIGVVVVCGDCREDECWREGLRAMEVEGKRSVGGVVTSPPYAEQRKREYGGIGEEEYGEWWRDVQIRVGEWLKEDGSFFLNMKAHSRDGERSRYVMDLVKRMKEEWGWKFIDEYCWLRNPPPGSWPNRLKNGFEPVYHFGLNVAIKFRPDNVKLDSKGEWRPSSNVNMGNYWNTADTAHEWDGSYPSNVLDVRENAPGIGHVAAYPVKVPEFFVKAFSDEGDVWVDPFCGSGSTLIACLENGRMGLGIEKEAKYVAITLQRFVEMYDLKPVKIGEL